MKHVNTQLLVFSRKLIATNKTEQVVTYDVIGTKQN